MLIDSFDNPAAGRLSSQSDDPAVEQGYVGGEYQVRLSSAAKPVRVVGANSVFADLQVAVDARLAEGTEGRWVGVACRTNPKDGTAHFSRQNCSDPSSSIVESRRGVPATALAIPSETQSTRLDALPLPAGDSGLPEDA